MKRSLPNILYKYRPVTGRSLDMLANNQVYFAHPNDFNDPFDCSAQENMHDIFRHDMAIALASIELRIQPAALTMEQIQQYRQRINQQLQSNTDTQALLDELRESLGILSLSARSDSIVMWSHYADTHRGFCLGFSIKNFGIPIEELRAVFYSKERNLNFAFNLISNPNMTEDRFSEEFWSEYALTKYVDWQYEQEWRVIGQARTISQYPDESIDRVIFGLRMSQNNRDQVRTILSKKNVNFFEAARSRDAFALEIRHLDN